MVAPPPGQTARPQLTLLAPAEALDRVRTAAVIARHACNGGVVRRLQVTYFDTPDRALFSQGISLRVQQSGTRQIQRLSQKPLRPGLAGREWEAPIEAGVPDLSRLPPAELPDDLVRLAPDLLEPVFVRRLRCRTQRIQLPDALVQIAFNDGRIEAGAHSAPLAEVQLDLQSGDPDALYEVGTQLLDIAPLRFATASECDRGFALALGAPLRATKAVAPAIAPFHAVDDAIAAIFGSCQQHLMANQIAAEDGRDPEGVHQARVALRRLRSALALFRRAVPSPQFVALSREAKWLAATFGPAREWDVLLTDTLVAPERACAPDINFAAFRAAAAAPRDRAYEAVRTALADPRASRLLLSLQRWIEHRGWRTDIPTEALAVLSEPIPAQAARLLTRLHAKALKEGMHLRHLDPDGRHALRIRLKRLRYAAEFFQPLWPGEAGERFVRRLARLQNTLGADSDAEATRPLLERIRAEAADPELHGAIGALIGWQACQRLRALQVLRKRWQRFKVAAPFWEPA